MFSAAWRLDAYHTLKHGFYPVSLVRSCGGERISVTNYPPPEFGVMRKKNQPGTGDSLFQHLAPMETKALSLFPEIVAHCAVTKYEDGDPRKPGWVVIRTSGSAWTLEAKDPDSCSRMTASASTLDDALTLLDLLLGAEQAPWEPDQWLRQSQQRNKK